MKFNPRSVLLNRGAIRKVEIDLPNQLYSYEIPDGVWEDAIKEFNKRLNKRPHVTMKMKDLKIDVLRVARLFQTPLLWVVIGQRDIGSLDKLQLLLKGEVVFAENSEVKVDKMIIQDIMYEDNRGLFDKKS